MIFWLALLCGVEYWVEILVVPRWLGWPDKPSPRAMADQIEEQWP